MTPSPGGEATEVFATPEAPRGTHAVAPGRQNNSLQGVPRLTIRRVIDSRGRESRERTCDASGCMKG